MTSLRLAALLACISAKALSASFPSTPQDVTSLTSANYPGVSVSYKETHICETNPGTKSYSGYVHLPASPGEGRSYPVNTFFWFFEARNNPDNAPLSLWLQGGPGSPSTPAALGEHGPCSVNTDSKSTTLNPWSWNTNVNMLYIDQPVQTGFSYDTLVNGTIDETNLPFLVNVQDFSNTAVPKTSTTSLTGTFASQNFTTIPVSSEMAAVAMWHFMQVWTQEFPHHRPQDDKYSIWTESYGGHYGPTFAAYFEKQNNLIQSGTIKAPASKMHLDTLGLVNACIDLTTQMPYYPQYAFNNTYDIQLINETQYSDAVSSWPQCKNLTETCRSKLNSLDPLGYGNSTEVNKACFTAYDFCFAKLWYAFGAAGKYQFDITAPKLGSFPPKLAAGYLNDAEVQQALGVPLNFTGNSVAIAIGFNSSGDFVKGHGVDYLGLLLDNGVKVALMYGDKDYQCNWLGGEAISLAIESRVAANFKQAGYADIQTNSSYVGGAVRQYGNFSFSRVYEAGHEVPYYQPETAFQIFDRIMSNKDVATGKQATDSTTSTYASSGRSEIFSVKNKVTPPRARYCYLWDMLETCTKNETALVTSGKAIIQDYILLGYKADNGTDVYYPDAVSAVSAQPASTNSSGGNGNGASGSGSTAKGGAAHMGIGMVGGIVALLPLILVVWQSI